MHLQRRDFLHGILAAPVGAVAGHRSPARFEASAANGAELQAFLRHVRPGGTVVLAPGDFGDVGVFELTVPDVTIRAASPLHSVLRDPLLVGGERATLVDLAFYDDVEGIFMATHASPAKTAAAARCSDSLTITASDVEVRGCTFGYFPARAILVRPGGLRPFITGCSFHSNRNGGASSNAHEAIALGYDNANSNTRMQARVVGNKLWNLNVEGEAICVKTSENLIEGNELSSSRAAFSNRKGERNLFKDNASVGAGGFAIEDRGTRLVANSVTGGGLFKILGGNTTADDMRTSSDLHNQATDTYLEANRGPLTIGYNYSGMTLPALNTTVVSHSGEIRLAAHKGTQLAGKT